MPPENVPWERTKDYALKDQRKHDRGASSDAPGSGSSSSSRWRDSYHVFRDFPRASPRSASPRRLLPGHYRQGGDFQPAYPDDSGGGGHGCTPSRSDRFYIEDESIRFSSSRYGSGRSNGSARDNHGLFRRSPFRGSGDFSRQQLQHGAPNGTATAQRSAAVPISSASQTLLKENDKAGGSCDGGLVIRRKFSNRGNSLSSTSWKPSMKWSRSGSLTSSKTARSEMEDAGHEVGLPSERETPIRSPVTSPLTVDEDPAKKKPRLGWGQGLAKYEKLKVEQSPDASASGSKGVFSDTSPKITSLSGCLSPATPCSATCSSSPGTDDKPYVKSGDGDIGKINKHNLAEGSVDEVPIRLDQLEVCSISNLTSLLADLLQPEDAFSGDSTFARHSALNKLMILKEDISKELEKTESDIDLFETELKSLDIALKSDLLLSSVSASPCTYQLRVSHNSVHDGLDITSPSDATVIKELIICDKLGEKSSGGSGECGQGNSSECCQPSALIGGSDPDLNSLGECTLNVEAERLECVEEEHINISGGGEENQMNPPNLGTIDWVDKDDSTAFENFNEITSSMADSNLTSLVMETNKHIARQASVVFDTVIQTNPTYVDIWGLVDLLSCRKNDLKVREKLSARKRKVRFKEQALTLKFIALHQLWKEDRQLLSIRRNRPRWSKHFELKSRFLQNGSKKQRSSVRTCFAFPAGNLTLVPTTEIVMFTTKLLQNSQIKMYRNYLKTPALLLDEEDRNRLKFDTCNGLIEDVPNLEEQRSLINPWSPEEKGVFLEMLSTFGKDFIKISSFLEHKTTADCVEFYYKNHKSESFKEVRKLLKLRKQRQCIPASTYLVTSGKMLNPEENSVSLDVLGAASLMTRAHGSASRQQKYIEKTFYGGRNDWTTSYRSHRYSDRDSSVEISSHERESVAADVLAGICSALSSEALTSCITSSIYPSEKMKFAATYPHLLEVAQSFDEDDIYSDEGCVASDSTDWTDDEKSLFVRALSIYGKDFAKISTCVRTRSREQCKIFYSKARKCLGLDMIHQDTGSVHIHLGDTNGGKSDTDDACAAEMESAIFSIPPCYNIDEEMSRTDVKSGSDNFAHAGSNVLVAEAEKSCQQDAIEADLESENNIDHQFSVCHDDNQLRNENSTIVHTLPKENVDALPGSSDAEGHHDIADSILSEIKNGGTAQTEFVTRVCLEGETHLPAASFASREVAGISADVVKEDEDSKQLPVPETLPVSSKSTNIDFTVSCSSTVCLTVDSNSNGPPPLQENKINICPQLNIVSNIQHCPQDDLLHFPPRKQQSFSLKQDNAHSGSLNSIFADTSSICFGGHAGISPQSSLNFEEHENKRHQHSANKDIFQHCVIRNPTWNQADMNLNVLRGYPLQLLNQDLKRDGDSIFDKPIFLEAYNKNNGVSHSNQFILPDMHGSKANFNTLIHSRPGILCPTGSESQSESQVRLCFQKASCDNEENRTADVKLFGTVLTHPSSLQKSNSLPHQSNIKTSSTLVNISSASNSCNTGKDGGAPALGPGSSGQNNLDEVPPIRSSGFWDGNRFQTGLSSLPESTVMSAKYQGASEVPHFPGKDGFASNNGILTDYQKSFTQHLSSDGKRLDTFNEFQRRNGTEMVPVLPQQGRAARLGANVFGGGLLLGSGGVSDPVTALKLHYARAKTYSNELESWRAADIGGR